MTKYFVSSLVFMSVMSGCATSKPSHHHTSEPTFFDHVVSSSVEPWVETQPSSSVSQRDPALKMVSSGWSKGSDSVTVGPNGGTFYLDLLLRQVATFEKSYKYTCNLYTWGEKTCEDYVCTSGAGKSELWDAYFGATRDKKVKTLGDAILGIGPVAAQSLHSSKVFPSKPKDWREFRERLNTALERKLISEKHYNDVFNTYGDRNRANLGYAEETCRTETYRCKAFGLYEVPNGCTGTELVQQVIGTAKRRVQLTVQSPQLQSFETEVLNVQAGLDYDSVTVSGGDKSQYVLVNKKPIADGAEIVLRGVERIRTKLPNAIKTVQFTDSPGSPVTFSIYVDPRLIGEGEDKLILKTQVTHCEPGGFFTAGDCKGKDEKAKKILEPVYHTIRQATSVLKLDAVPVGHRIWVEYSIQRENSRFYLNTPVQVTTKRLDDVKQ